MKFVWAVALVGFGSCQNLTQALVDLYNAEYSLHQLHRLITVFKGLNAIGQVGKKAVPLGSPRPDYGITPDAVQYYLQHSLLAVCKPTKLDVCFCKGKFVDMRMFRNESFDAQAAVAADPKNKLIVVSYRGAVSVKNWDTNFRSELVSYPGLDSKIKVHQGQLEHFQSLHRQMEPVVLKMLAKYKGYKLHVTGFSLGASLSAIALPTWTSLLKSRRLGNKAQLFIYSGPRPGNLEFSQHLETLGVPLVRYARSGDVVPHVPDQSMGYSHAGQEFHDGSQLLHKRRTIRCSVNVVEDPFCLLRDTDFYAINHFFPFQARIPTPPFC